MHSLHCRSLVWASWRPLFLTPQISNLCNLTTLDLQGWIGDYHQIASLSALCDLQVQFYGCNRQPFPPQPLLGPTTRLTRLDVLGTKRFHQVSLSDWLLRMASKTWTHMCRFTQLR